MFRLRAGYFPGKESSQSSPGLRARTQRRSPVALVVPAGAGNLLKVSLIVIAAALLNDLKQVLLPVYSAPRPSSILPGG